MSQPRDNMTAAEQADQALGWALETLQAQLEIDINNAWGVRKDLVTSGGRDGPDFY